MNKHSRLALFAVALLSSSFVLAASSQYESAAVSRIVGDSISELKQQLSQGDKVFQHGTYYTVEYPSLGCLITNNEPGNKVCQNKALFEQSFPGSFSYGDGSFSSWSWNELKNEFDDWANNELFLLESNGVLTSNGVVLVNRAGQQLTPNDVIVKNAFANRKPLFVSDAEYGGLYLPNTLAGDKSFIGALGQDSVSIATTSVKNREFTLALMCYLTRDKNVGEAFREARNNYYWGSGKPSGLALMSYFLYGTTSVNYSMPAQILESDWKKQCSTYFNSTGFSIVTGSDVYGDVRGTKAEILFDSPEPLVQEISLDFNNYQIIDFNNYSLLTVNGTALRSEFLELPLPVKTIISKFPEKTIIVNITVTSKTNPIDLDLNIPSWNGTQLIDRLCSSNATQAGINFTGAVIEDDSSTIVDVNPVEVVNCEEGRFKLYRSLVYRIEYLPYSPVLIKTLDYANPVLPSTQVNLTAQLELVGFLSNSTGEYEPDENTVALYHFNEEGTEEIVDSSGNGFNGIGQNLLSIEGVYDNGVSFSEPNSYANFTQNELGFETNFTVEARIKIGNIPESYEMFISREGWGGNYYLGITPEGKAYTQINIDQTGYALTSDRIIADGEWHHVALTYDGVVFKQWIDGVEEKSTELTGVAYSDPRQTTWFGGKQSADIYKFHGELDEARFSNTARTEFNANSISGRLVLKNGNEIVAQKQYNGETSQVLEFDSDDEEKITSYKLEFVEKNEAKATKSFDLETLLLKTWVEIPELVENERTTTTLKLDNKLDHSINANITYFLYNKTSYVEERTVQKTLIPGVNSDEQEFTGLKRSNIAYSLTAVIYYEGRNKTVSGVITTNHAPELSEIQDITVNETQVVLINPQATDLEEDPITFEISSPVGNDGVWNTTYNDSGTYFVRVNASDGLLKDSRLVKLTILNKNRPPILQLIGSKNVNEEQLLQIQLNASDADGEEITYSTSASEVLPSNYSFNSTTGLFKWTPAQGEAGTYFVSFNASDLEDQDFEVVKITVNSTQNHAPILSSIGNKTVNENQTLTIQLNASDSDNDELVFGTNAFTKLPSAFSFNTSTGKLVWTPTFEDAGIYNVLFNVTDGSLTDSETINITVKNVNRAPALTDPGNKQIEENNKLTIQLTATDADGDAVNYSSNANTALPSTYALNSTTGLFEWTPRLIDAGTYSVTFGASDGQATTLKTISITVNNSLVPGPVSPDYKGKPTNPSVNGKLDSFGALYFVWERISNAKNYSVSVKYNGPYANSFDYPNVTYTNQSASGNISLPIPATQMDKQADGFYEWRIGACIGASPTNCAWHEYSDTWFSFNKTMIPETLGPQSQTLTTNTKLEWNASRHDAAVNGLELGGKPDYLIIKLQGLTGSQNTCLSEPLPANCYLVFPYKTSSEGIPGQAGYQGNYYQFNQTYYNQIAQGTYDWSISLFEGELSTDPYYKQLRLQKTRFGQTKTITKN
ncbi:hypothetical protein HUU53_00140 [Candidatus Micrarchaeota archaeon]|nr:hypothetical protein [Candidatus Micrarchaeota archaeon]